MIRLLFCALMLWTPMLGSGCATRSGSTPDARSGALGDRGSLALAEDPWKRLARTDNGLEVRQWMVADDPARLASALMAHRSGEALEAPLRERLRRNGFRLVRLPVGRLDELLADLGGTMIHATAWHGQVLRWREMIHRAVPPTGRAIAIDGRTQRYEGGSFRLMVRAWTMQMEDGPFLHLEAIPQYRPPAPDGLGRRLGGPQPPPGEWLDSLALELRLEEGFAYVLTGESPHVPWPKRDDEEPGGAGREPPDHDPNDPPPVRGGRRLRGPSERFGPEGVPPTTVGELLFGGEGGRTGRGILVLVPKVAPHLFPPDRAADPPAAGE